MSIEEKNEIDVTERSVPRDGSPQALDRRLFMALHIFTGGGVDAEAALMETARDVRVHPVDGSIRAKK